MSMGLRKVLVVAGGSGGHIFPAVGFCQELRQKYGGRFEVQFAVSSNKNFSGVAVCDPAPLFLKGKKTPLGVLRLLLEAFYQVVVRNPAVVVGFGGYVTVPFIILGRLFGKKVFIHEQNAVPGRANRFLKFWVRRIGVTFPTTAKFFDAQKTFLVRYPLRASMQKVPRSEALNFFDFKDHLFTILVIGGSQGARRINAAFLEALKISRYGHRIQVIHLCGPQEEAAVSEAYRNLPVRSRVFSFLKEMHFAYTAADLVIGRSGAGCVQEILFFGRPSILIPYPHAGGHQKDNARALAEIGAALFLEEEKATAQALGDLISLLIDDDLRRKTMAALATGMRESGAKMTMAELVVAS